MRQTKSTLPRTAGNGGFVDAGTAEHNDEERAECVIFVIRLGREENF